MQIASWCLPLTLFLLLSQKAHQLLWEGLTKLGLEPFVEKPSDR
jgi:hypothetical protein